MVVSPVQFLIHKLEMLLPVFLYIDIVPVVRWFCFMQYFASHKLAFMLNLDRIVFLLVALSKKKTYLPCLPLSDTNGDLEKYLAILEINRNLP